MGGRLLGRGILRATILAGIGLATTVALPQVASAADPATTAEVTTKGTATDTRRARNPNRFVALEVNGVVTREMVPTSFLGLDAALAFGNRTFALRAGGSVQGAPTFRLYSNQVSNLLTYGLLDACASKNVREHRVRMCLGGELGGWTHFWSGYGDADREYSMHVAGTLKGDYRYAFTRNFGLLLGVGLSIPAVGPQFRGRDDYGRTTPVLVPGPVAGSIRIGASFGIG